LPWNPNPQAGFAVTMVSGVVVQGSTVYVGGTFEQLAGSPRHGLGAIDAVTGQQVPWEFQVGTNESVNRLSADANRVFVAGQFSALNDRVALNIAAVPTVAALFRAER
jgi:hypothetical protein